ncbi:something about silencing, SAS, complex subunit 4-domain-containing protein [Clohesyomyces aquaticus]|uniref:Something about silencing, SAS, complex subunit 4-domain-containing protein n=1 Tax=Clohesyomyces aquaticus TaxID=1231657 RepID=A0A1Y1ZXQ6_9PLEO|nr:something about silencing, SAS, complex subunit 4-domain-containing protein [Clohesyomyces aquaticus]
MSQTRGLLGNFILTHAEFLDLETPMYIVDEPLKTTAPALPTSSTPSRNSVSPARSRKSRGRTPQHVPNPPSSLLPSLLPSQSSITYQVLDYSTIARHLPNGDDQDPLADSVFLVQHRRAERKEKQLRNIEKERAMHEKVQLERLLDGLQGPDWLKVMGITGVTDGERKDWEPKRDYFVKEVEALVDKFRIWKEEEKRLRAEKEAAVAAREEASGDEDDEDDDESEAANTNTTDSRSASIHQRLPRTNHSPTQTQPPKPRRPPRPQGFLLLLPPEPTTPFVSFYAKPHLRAAALGKHRHGRNASAFGQPVPEFEDKEFEMPEEYLTEEALRVRARKRRREKRGSGVGGEKE